MTLKELGRIRFFIKTQDHPVVRVSSALDKRKRKERGDGAGSSRACYIRTPYACAEIGLCANKGAYGRISVCIVIRHIYWAPFDVSPPSYHQLLYIQHL